MAPTKRPYDLEKNVRSQDLVSQLKKGNVAQGKNYPTLKLNIFQTLGKTWLTLLRVLCANVMQLASHGGSVRRYLN